LNQVKVAHIADVHWRGLSRHEEYRKVFTKFIDEVKQEEVDCILIGGDIVHSKTQGISPELIDCLTWWFDSMARVAPVVVVLGNHDGLINNKDRQDAITPILEALRNPNITLYKRSDTYDDDRFQIPISWGNFSCFDEEGWDRVVPHPGRVNIALYHGALRGALTDIDYTCESENDMKLFEGFQFGMFGDIHRQQFLDREKRFAYPGSTIQQNYGESIDKGYLLWTIRSANDFDVESRNISNDTPYVTIRWKGSVIDTLAEGAGLDGARFRIAVDTHLLQEEIKAMSAALKENLSASEIVWKIEDNRDAEKLGLKNEKLERENLRDPEVHKKLVRKFLDTEKFDESDFQLMEELVDSHLKRMDDEEAIRNVKWSLKSMDWDNTFAYGKDNHINFANLNGVVGLFGQNRTGKSSIPGTLMYGLYNGSDRGNIKNINIVNTRKGYCRAKCCLTIDGNDYVVERQTIKHTNKRGQVSAGTQLNIFGIDKDGNHIDFSGEQRRDSDKLLQSLVGSAEDFLLTSFASQGEMNTFIKEKATARKVYLGNFLDLNVFERVLYSLKEESNHLKSFMKNSPSKDYDTLITQAKTDLARMENEAEELRDKIDVHRKKVENLNVELLTHKDRDQVTSADVDSKENEIKETSELVEGYVSKMSSLRTEIDEVNTKISKIEDLKKNFPIENLRSQLSEMRDLDKSVALIESNLEREKDTLKSKERSAARLSEVPCGDAFPTCKFIKDSHKDKAKIAEQQQLIERLSGELRNSKLSLRKYAELAIESKVQRYEEILKKEIAHRGASTNLETQYELVKTRHGSASRKLNNLSNELESMRLRVTDSDEANVISELKQRISSLNAQIKEWDARLKDDNRSIGMNVTKVEELEKDKSRFEENRKKWRVYEKLLAAYGKDGIPLNIITSELPRINAEISSILQGVAGFTVVLESETGSTDLEVYLDYGDSRRPIELGSGMEKMLGSIAIRVALINVSSLPKTDMFVIDEGFGALDETSVEACNRLLSSLKKWFRVILVISHVDAVKESVDEVIEITRVGQDARVRYE
jgi:DNA repair exonuclease SbcCD ATPase subunit/DNA repair exonuclease SbcCD nuclease subunit